MQAATESCRDGKNWCYFHPNQMVIGVCAFCLNQRLLILAASDQHRNGSHRRRRRRTIPHIHLPKIFALTNSLLKQRKTQDDQSSFTHSSSSSTQEESFISIKFEENGAASWEKSTTMATMEKYCDASSWKQNDLKKKKEGGEEGGVVRAVVVVEPRGGGGGASSSLRWRKRIGHIFQLMRWKRSSSSSSAAMGNVGTKLEGHHVKVRHGWIRTLTKNNNNNKAGGLMSTQTRGRCS